MTNSTTSHQLSPQSNAFEPYRPYTTNAASGPRPPASGRAHDAHVRSFSSPSQHSTPSPLPWQIPPTITERDPTAVDAIRALNEHYAQKSFPAEEVEHIMDRYNEHLSLIQAALDLRDGWSQPQIDAGFLPLPKSDEGDPSNTTVFIGGLSSPIPTDLLRVFFIPFGDIDYVKTPEGKSCGFVRYKRRTDAEHAIKKMQGFELESCRFRLSWGKNPSSHDNRQAPSSTVNPALINRLASYIDAQHAKELLCCIDVVFEGNTRMFREALEFLGSSVAACNHRNHADDHGRRNGSYPVPVDPATINPHLSPRSRTHLSATGELPEQRERDRASDWPSHKPALNASARVFQHGQSYGRTGQTGPYALNDSAGHLQRHNSASSDEMYPLELEYGPLTPSPPTTATAFDSSRVPSQASKTPEGFWSDADVAPSFYAAGPMAPHSQSPPGIWSTGQPSQSTMHSSYLQTLHNAPQYTDYPVQAYDQSLSVSAPSNPADLTSVRGSNGFARRLSDPIDDKTHAPTLAAQGHFGSVGQQPFVPSTSYGSKDWTGTASSSGAGSGAMSATVTAFNPFSQSAFTPLGPLGGSAIGPKSAQQPQQSASASVPGHSAKTATPANANGPAALARAVNRLALQQSGTTTASTRSSATPRAVPSTPARPSSGPRAPIGPRSTVRA